MARDGSATRTAIMDAAEALILGQGFAATSVDRIVEQAGVTKGSFFYHFPSKAELAHALVSRWAALDLEHLETNFARAEQLSRDPLQQLLIFVGLVRELAQSMPDPSQGCLFASYCYEAELFDARTLDVAKEDMLAWRHRIAGKLREVLERYPPRFPVSPDSLAEMLTVLFEGGFVVTKLCHHRETIGEQLEHYRNYLELLFAPETARPPEPARKRAAGRSRTAA